jgi:hypothetical protein
MKAKKKLGAVKALRVWVVVIGEWIVTSSATRTRTQARNDAKCFRRPAGAQPRVVPCLLTPLPPKTKRRAKR